MRMSCVEVQQMLVSKASALHGVLLQLAQLPGSLETPSLTVHPASFGKNWFLVWMLHCKVMVSVCQVVNKELVEAV